MKALVKGFIRIIPERDPLRTARRMVLISPAGTVLAEFHPDKEYVFQLEIPQSAVEGEVID